MKNLFAFFMIFGLTGCLTKDYKSGVPIRESQIQEIKKATTKKEVYEILGSPASTNFIGDEKWFYYTAEGKIFAFLDPKFSKYEILSIKFNKDDTISEIKLKNIANKNLKINTEKETYLPSEIKLNFFEELFGNIGKFNASNMPNSI